MVNTLSKFPISAIYPFYQKLNYNCPASEKSGDGPGSCGGKDKEEGTEKEPKAESKFPVGAARDAVDFIVKGGRPESVDKNALKSFDKYLKDTKHPLAFKYGQNDAVKRLKDFVAEQKDTSVPAPKPTILDNYLNKMR
jgi:hypothetical protein